MRVYVQVFVRADVCMFVVVVVSVCVRMCPLTSCSCWCFSGCVFVCLFLGSVFVSGVWFGDVSVRGVCLLMWAVTVCVFCFFALYS